MNVLVICHQLSKWEKGEEIGKTFDGWPKLEYELNLVLNVFEVAGQRKAKVDKSRFASFEQAAVVDWSYETFRNIFGAEVTEASATHEELATDAQQKRIAALIELLSVSDEDVLKVWESSGVTGWDQMTTARIGEAISKLERKLKQ